jgi:hypothetical protein
MNCEHCKKDEMAKAYIEAVVESGNSLAFYPPDNNPFYFNEKSGQYLKGIAQR